MLKLVNLLLKINIKNINHKYKAYKINCNDLRKDVIN